MCCVRHGILRYAHAHRKFSAQDDGFIGGKLAGEGWERLPQKGIDAGTKRPVKEKGSPCEATF